LNCHEKYKKTQRDNRRRYHMMNKFSLFSWLFVFFVAIPCSTIEAAPDFTKDVAPVLAKYCSGCHNDTDLEGELSFSSFDKLQKGGEKGAVVVPNRADASLMIRVLTGEVEPSMPPKDNPRPKPAEIDILRAWIDAGAKGPNGKQADFPALTTPKIKAAPGVKDYITSLALSPDGKRLALGRYRHVELVDPATKHVEFNTKELPGKVNSISYSRDGAYFVAASGIPGLYGVATICKASDGTIVKQLKGHRDAVYDARFSPNGKLLATCSYDRQILLWQIASGMQIRALSGHNGAVFELAFSPDGSILASASADATAKIWSVKTGERLDTLGQPESDQYAVAFSPDGNSIVAGGADRQLRLWQLVSRQRPEINPLKFSRTAHDSTIVKLAFSPSGSKLVSASEGRELVLWDATALTPVHRYEQQPDVVTGLAFEPSGDAFYAARIDGSWKRYALPQGGSQNQQDADQDSRAVASFPTMDKSPRAESTEQEPNNLPASANQISTNSLVSGVISAAAKDGAADADVFRFHAQKGQQLVLEIKAARPGGLSSPLDSKLEVLDANGKPIPRVVLQAVRSTYFTFRGHNSTDRQDFRLHGANDMEFNDYLYANGEVMKLWLNPRGPDSGFLVYPGYNGDRFTYFGTSAITHALNETCYIVEPHRPDESLIPNGLPEYTLYYENDDDDRRKFGSDSRIRFTAPADGDYLARVSDVRGQGGDAYKYQLIVRPPRPDFQVKLVDKDRSINAGSGKEFSVVATRTDEFDGEIRLDVTGLPPGFHASSPLTIQAGQTTAYGVLNADADAPMPTPENAKLARVVASAQLNGKTIKKKPLDFGEIQLMPRPKLVIRILPVSGAPAATVEVHGNAKQADLYIAPGQTIPAIVKLERNGFDGEVKFGTEFAGRNLPHGIYVDNIGLNGMTLLKGESQRTFFLTARKWVPEQSRPFHIRASEEGNQTSLPVMLHVGIRQDQAAPKTNSVVATPDAN
jgi:WD40 repeat protein